MVLDIKFEKVIPTETQINLLYLFLNNREHSISHFKMPTKSEHASFILNNPYLEWYLVFEKEKLICSTYIKDDNSIGINLLGGYENQFKNIIKFIKDHHKPLPGIKSVRREEFTVSISSTNIKLLELLNKQKFSEISRTFVI